MDEPLELIHIGGSRHTVIVRGEAYRVTGLTVFWGSLSGTYTLNLKKNQLVRAPAWSAVDVAYAWTLWRSYSGKGFAVVKLGRKVACLLCGGCGWKDGVKCPLCQGVVACGTQKK
jgi:hypothetical protein